ncbi:4a-hydroxytetrahydrobiopterin dehydratase [Candidatus Sumerlaeota bacterium]|nr:4a-hydroxytetrahydrobiopterin dehydratase [Candidatus Sumerlaeota bacterium]
MADLTTKHCKPCEGGVAPLNAERAQALLSEIESWELDEGSSEIHRVFEFKDFHATMAFVNAVAWIAHTEDHHPDMEVHWGKCRVRFSTHAIGGLSENDFICAAKVNALLGGQDRTCSL